MSYEAYFEHYRRVVEVAVALADRAERPSAHELVSLVAAASQLGGLLHATSEGVVGDGLTRVERTLSEVKV